MAKAMTQMGMKMGSSFLTPKRPIYAQGGNMYHRHAEEGNGSFS